MHLSILIHSSWMIETETAFAYGAYASRVWFSHFRFEILFSWREGNTTCISFKLKRTNSTWDRGKLEGYRMDKGEERKRKREKLWLPMKIFFSSSFFLLLFFFFYNISRTSKRTRGHTQERSTMKISYVEINSSHRRLRFRRSKRKYYRMKMTRVDKT